MKKFAIKKDGKWQNIASVGENQWGNLTLSINKKKLVALLKDESIEWINLSVFDEKPKEPSSEVPAQETEVDSVPF